MMHWISPPHQGRIQRGSLGSQDPPPEIYQGCQKNDVLVKNTKNVLFLELSEFSVFYEIKQPISSERLRPPRPLLHIWLKMSLYLLRYALNLGLGMILVLYY